MAQTGFTPAKLYRSTVIGNVPAVADLQDGELAINTADGKLFYKTASSTVGTIQNSPTLTAGTGISLTPGSGSITIASTVSSGASSLDGLSDVAVDGTSMLLGRNSVGSVNLYNTSIGVGSLASNTTGYSNTANGRDSLYSNTTGYSNTANGRSALYSNTTGSSNTGIGVNALYSNTTGFNNTANGWDALYSNTTGYSNTANGVNALNSNTTGYWNTAIGVSALRANTTGYQNTAIGVYALYSNTTGYNNTANGFQALYYNTTGNQNTGLGVSALYYNTTGTNNTANGFQALLSNTTGTNNTALGNNAQGSSPTSSNEVTLGNSAVTALRCQATSITSLSDERDKTNWNYNIAGLDFINDLTPGYFTWNTRDKAKVDIKAAGFSAQQLLATQTKHNAEHLDLVSTINLDKLEARYSNLLPALVKAIQDLSEKVDTLSLQNQTLQQEIINLRNTK